jgi:hypothetical protein
LSAVFKWSQLKIDFIIADSLNFKWVLSRLFFSKNAGDIMLSVLLLRQYHVILHYFMSLIRPHPNDHTPVDPLSTMVLFFCFCDLSSLYIQHTITLSIQLKPSHIFSSRIRVFCSLLKS